jgi:hypothetical protein
MARKQTEIPGTERKRYPALEKKAEAFVETRDKRMRLTEKEHEDKIVLLAAMRERFDDLEKDDEGNAVYVYDADDGPVRITCSRTENVTVRKDKPKSEEPEAEAAE